MTNNLHARAKDLIAQQRVEHVSSDDERWLNAHLAECESCAEQQRQLNESLSALRTMQFDLPPNLASRTQLRVRMRAEELREHGPANRLIWAVAIMSWVFGLATAPFVWRGFAWLGGELHLPKLVWAAGVVLWWIVPGIVAAGMVVLQKRGLAREAE
jgi:hypothetical protein